MKMWEVCSLAILCLHAKQTEGEYLKNDTHLYLIYSDSKMYSKLNECSEITDGSSTQQSKVMLGFDMYRLHNRK